MNITQVGIDLAKLVFQVHGVDARGKVALRKQLKRHQIVAFFAQMPPCLVGMEACGGAHFWARKLAELGHTVKLIAPQFVKPYVKTNKNDAADAEAICEAVGRPNMRFVPIKNTEQQALLGLHRARKGFVIERTAQANQIRGLLTEFGLVYRWASAASGESCRNSSRMPKTAYRRRAAHCSLDYSSISERSIDRSRSWSEKSTPGIVRTQRASAYRQSQGSVR
jgi:transposase